MVVDLYLFEAEQSFISDGPEGNQPNILGIIADLSYKLAVDIGCPNKLYACQNLIILSTIFCQRQARIQGMVDCLTVHQRVHNLKQKVEKIPLKCRLFIQMLLAQLPKASDLHVPKDFKKAYSSLTQTFTKQNDDQKLSFLEELTFYLFSCLDNAKKETSFAIEAIETKCEVKGSFVGFERWENKRFKYSHQNSRITLSTSKKEDVLLLKNYLARRSASEKDAIVLESIEKTVSEKLSKVTIKFASSSIFHELYRTIRKNIIELSQQTLEEFLKEDLREGNIQQPNRNNSKYTILTTKTMTAYFNTKQSLCQKMKRNKNRCMLLYNRDNTKIYRSSENKKYYYLEQVIFKAENIQSIKQHTTILGSKSVPNKLLQEVLQSFTQNITANYYKLEVGLKEYQFVVITERTQKDGYHQTVMKSATHFVLDVSIQFIVATIKRVKENQFLLEIGLHLKFESKRKTRINQQIQQLLLAMAHNDVAAPRQSTRKIIVENENLSMINRTEGIQYQVKRDLSIQLQIVNPNEENFTTSSGRNEESEPEEEQQQFYSIASDGEEGDVQDLPEMDNREVQAVLVDQHYLKIKPFNKPLSKGQMNLLTQHYLFGEWGKSSKGGVVCINQAVIKQQNRILKLVITRIGSNVFKGNSVMNISLPVQLFRDQSALISIGRNLTYAPILIEPCINSNPIQRMKSIAIFEISMAGLALSTKKPFNPILGETFQGMIDGCPLFVEQISHHPPITSIYFVGRGYKIYGTMKVEAHLGINKVRGVNNAIMTLQFDNGDKINFEIPVMLINGLLFGERSIYFQGTVHIVDQKNLLITQITYDAENAKKGLLSFTKTSPDFLSGEIYQVSQDCMKKFKHSDKTICLRKQEGSKVISKLQGQWNGKVFIDNTLAFNFQNQLPVKLEKFSCPLPSDSIFRSDVIELLKGDMNSAQDQKDRLEELQRRDKKLRQKYHTSSGKK